MAARVHTVGVISDTHGLLRPEALAALAGVERIVHAGDIGAPDVLDALGRIAPVTAVRGNNDRERWAAAIPETDVLEIGEVSLYVLHDLHALDLDPRAAGFAAVIAGHSHQPRMEERDGVLYLNPGSAGPRRFKLPISLARLTVAGSRLRAELVTLDVPAVKKPLRFSSPSPASTDTTAAPRSWPTPCATPAWRSSTPASSARRRRSSPRPSRRT
jgi:putative phosphoesterase